MKSATSEYITLEGASTRQPVEIYKIWRGSTYWYYTSGDVAVTFDSQEYTPATLKRGSVQYRGNLEASELELVMSKDVPVVTAYHAASPVNPAWIEIKKLFRDQDPADALVVFVGMIRSVKMNGPAALARCVGIEKLLSLDIPQITYGPVCNWTLFSTECGETAASYKISPQVTVSADGKTLTAAAFGSESSGYFTLGSAEFGDYKSFVVNHVGTAITLMRAIPGLETDDTVDVYPGCDGSLDTCRSKYSNVNNFGGFPYVPIDNPSLWMKKT